MAQHCKTCAHPSRREIERLREGGSTLHDLVAAFGLTQSTLHRHFAEHHPRTRPYAEECTLAAQGVAVLPGQVGSGSSAPALAPPLRRRAIAGARRTQGPLHPVARPDNDPGSPAAASIVPFRAPLGVPIEHPRKSLISTDATELSLLASLGCTDQQLGELIGCGAGVVAEIIGENRGDDRALFNVTHQTWAKHFIRLAMEELIGLRRRRQDALDGKRWREADRFDPKIAKANNDLFLTLQRFGLVGPIDPSELSKEGDDARDILGMLITTMAAGKEPEFTEQQQSCVDREARRLAGRHHAIA